MTVLPPASISGLVFEDFNANGDVDFGEHGIAGVTVRLAGTDDLGHPVALSRITDGDGAYVFRDLRPGNYIITEEQPARYTQGVTRLGTAGGTASADQIFLGLAAGVDALNYNYGERPQSTGGVKQGQTAGIGFWNNKNGQALIRGLDGSVGTQLGDWLAATLPNMFGRSAGGSNLGGKNNAYIATFFRGLFVQKGRKLDAQVLATALAVYVTNATLDDTGFGTQYSFNVQEDGVGAATANVGTSGDAFGVADNTTMSILDLLLATDAQAVNGTLYNGVGRKRDLANTVYSAINQAGSIG